MIGLGFALRGTLTTPRPIEREAFIELIREQRQAHGQAFVAAEAGQVADELFLDSMLVVAPAELVEAALRLVRTDSPGQVLVARFRQIADRIVSRTVQATPGMRVTLERIGSLGIPSAVLCNGWSRIAQREAACAGFTGRVLVSEDIGFPTPDAQAFDALAGAIGLPPDCIWYVGDDPKRDIHGAAMAGMRAVWFNPSGVAYPGDLEPPALTIREPADLLPPLCEEYTRSLLSLRHVMRTALDFREGHYVPSSARW
jgi:FMN phosphatase YigB (HAD superfamily)